MINWNIRNSKEKGSNWFFPSFEVQEYLLPIINVGGPTFDEYGATKYSLEDCLRLRNTIEYAIEGYNLSNKDQIRFETMHKGLESLDKSLVNSTLKALDEAAKRAIEKQRGLVFYGD